MLNFCELLNFPILFHLTTMINSIKNSNNNPSLYKQKLRAQFLNIRIKILFLLKGSPNHNPKRGPKNEPFVQAHTPSLMCRDSAKLESFWRKGRRVAESSSRGKKEIKKRQRNGDDGGWQQQQQQPGGAGGGVPAFDQDNVGGRVQRPGHHLRSALQHPGTPGSFQTWPSPKHQAPQGQLHQRLHLFGPRR